MTAIGFPYIDMEIEQMLAGGAPPEHLRHFHWGLYDDTAVADDRIERYLDAARCMTEHILAAGGMGDHGRVLDVGCGFGGTLDLIRARHQGCRLVGLNIDERQLRWGRVMLTAPAGGDSPISFLAGDGCRLPVADRSVDRVLAVECVFHFPSRKAFFREAARVLEPGGTLALSDFVVASGSMGAVGAGVTALGLGDWFGRSAAPSTPEGYARLARATGLEPLVDDDVTARTLPTYAALHRLYREQGFDDGARTIDAIERLAMAGGWRYHVMAFRRHGGGT